MHGWIDAWMDALGDTLMKEQMPTTTRPPGFKKLMENFSCLKILKCPVNLGRPGG